MTLENYLQGGPPHEQETWERLEACLIEKGLRHVKGNFQHESRLTQDVWSEIFGALAHVPHENLLSKLTSTLEDHTLSSSPITGTPRPKGRARELGRFVDDARREGVVLNKSAQRQLVDDVESVATAVQAGQQPSDASMRQLRQCPLGRYVIWATFDAAGGGNPLAGCSGASATRHRFGLPEAERPMDRRLLLLVYEVPDDVTVHCPTVADAYAGKGWNDRFECADRGRTWGTTSGGQPEIVHGADGVAGDCLISPIGTANYSALPLRLVD